MKEEIGVGIDTEELLAIFECNICLSSFSEPTTTKCGHTYCRSCIEACIKKQHECPDCKTPLELSDLTRNIPLEQMAQQIERLKQSQGNMEVGNGGPEYVLSPVVKILQEELRSCVGKFEAYCHNVRLTVDQLIRDVKERNMPDADKEIEELERRYREQIGLVIKQYAHYMREDVSEPKIGSVNVVIQMPSKHIRIESYSLRPYDTLKEVKVPIEKHLALQANPVVMWDSEICYEVHPPNAPHFVITDEKKSVMELGIVPGTNIVLKTKAACAMDLPKPCITLNFKAEDQKAYTYYSCADCSLKWICEPCAQTCHKGHNLKEFLKNHVPQWACCYCLKKRCIVPNKNNPA